MSQILKRLSETETTEEPTPGAISLVSSNPFDSPALDAEKLQSNQKLFFNRFGYSIIGAAILAACVLKLHKRTPTAPIPDFTKLLQAEVAKLNHQAIESFYSGNLEKSDELLQHAEQLDPRSTASFVNRAIVLRHQNKLREAESEFDKALSINSGDPAALNGLGRIYLDAGKLDQAETYFKRAITKNPVPVEALLNLGELEENQENWTQASRYYTLYLESPNADPALKMVVSRRNQNILATGEASRTKE